MDMNYIDIIIIIILAFAMINGFINGLVKEVASLAALIFGIWGAIKFSNFTAVKLYDYFDMGGQYIGIISFIITFLMIVVIIHFIGMLIDKLMGAVSLGFLNKLLGIVFGLFKSVLIMSVVFVVINAIDLAPALFPIIGEGSLKHSFDRLKKKPSEVTV
jgi:membrane protein required for colicin V production